MRLSLFAQITDMNVTAIVKGSCNSNLQFNLVMLTFISNLWM